MSAFDVAIVGCGRITELGYLPALEQTETVRLVAVVDPDEARCARLASGVPAYPDLGRLLEVQRPDLLVIAAPAAIHLALAREAALAGVRSLVEKPPAETLADAVSLMALEPQPFMGLNRRFDPDLAELRRRVRRGGNGALHISLEFAISPRAWGAYTVDDGPLLDLAPHLVDLACWISGSAPRRVRSVDAQEADELFEIEWEGGRARLHVSHAAGWRECVDVQGEQGRVGRVVTGGLWRRAASRIRGSGSPLPASLGAQLAAVASVEQGAVDDRLAGAADGVRVMAVLDGVLRSRSDGGSWVDVLTAQRPPG